MQSKRSSVFRAAFLGTVLMGVTTGIVVVGLASATQAFADQASHRSSFRKPNAALTITRSLRCRAKCRRVYVMAQAASKASTATSSLSVNKKMMAPTGNRPSGETKGM